MNQLEFSDALRRLADGAALEIDRTIEAPLFQYLELLRRWNRTMNLTALPLDPPADEAIERLMIEPLLVARGVDLSAARWFDIGSGNGSPAIPIKLARPALQLTMVESKSRKAVFLREVSRALGLSAAVDNARFESLADRPELSGALDLVTIRAVRIDASLIALCAFLLRSSGQLVLLGYRGGDPAGFRRSGDLGLFVRSTWNKIANNVSS